MGEPAQHHLSFPPSPAVPLRRTVAPFALSGNALLIPVKRGKGQRNPGLSRFGRLAIPSLFLLLWLSGCSFGQEAPTRTPFPTWTPTPIGQPSQGEAATVQANTVQANTVQANTVPTDTPLPPPPAAPTDTPTTVPPTPAPTDTPAATPTPAPTDTPADTPTPEPTATTAFAFTLEAAEKFPTDSLAANVVRIYLYVYSPVTYGLPGYTLQVIHNGSPLTVDEVSTEGIPEQTRPEPGPYTRFANMSVVFVEPQAGRWDIQLLDPQRAPVGPPVAFDLTADERTRELYVRYQQQ